MDLTEDHLWTLGVPDIKKLLLANNLPRFGTKNDLIARLLEFQSERAKAKLRKEEENKEDEEHSSNRASGSGVGGGSVGGGVASSSSSSMLAGGGLIHGGSEPRAYPSVLNPSNPPLFHHQDLPLNTNRLPLNYIAAPIPSRLAPSFPFAFSAPPHPNPPLPSSSSSSSSVPLYPPQQQLPQVLGSSSSQASQFFFENPLRNPPPPFPNPSSNPSSQLLFPPPPHLQLPTAGPSKRKSSHPDDSSNSQPVLQRARSTIFDLKTLTLVAPTSSLPGLLHYASLTPSALPSSSKRKSSSTSQPSASSSSSSSLDQSEPLPVFAGQPWRRVLSRQIFCEGLEVGSLRASFVRRETIAKGKFHEVMWDAEQDLGAFGLECFDADGRVRVELTKGKESGSGVWGSEISRGTFIYLHEIIIHSTHHRSQGLGLTSFRALLGLLDRMKSQNVLSYIPSFIFAHPQLLEPPDDLAPPVASSSSSSMIKPPEEAHHVTERATQFFRRVGFRRVGRTEYFGYATTDINHPSRAIPLGSDSLPFPPPPPSHHQLHPIQYLLSSSQTSTSTSLSQTLFTCPPDLISVQDHLERTPLHVAAQHGLLVPCQILVQRSRAQLWVTDSRGLTPLQELRRALRREREERVTRKLPAEGDEGRGEEERTRWKEKLDCERFLELEERRRA